MSDKENISATVDPEVSAYLSRESVNASGLINQLVKKQMSSNGDSEELIKLRLEQINSEIEGHENDIERLEEERELLLERLENLQSENDDERENKLRKLQMVPDDEDHPLVQEVAEELDMTPQEALTEADEL